jgi:hypothetical protein
VAERHLANERLNVKALTADVDRLSCEKLDVQERFDATKVSPVIATRLRPVVFQYNQPSSTAVEAAALT